MSATDTIGCPNCGEPLTLDPATHVGHADGSCVRGNREAVDLDGLWFALLRCVQRAFDRIEARRAAERIRPAKRGSEATQATRLAAAPAKRDRKRAKRSPGAEPEKEKERDA